MRIILVVLGFVIALMGSIWALQGVGVLIGSFMSNSPPWIAIGSVTAVVGVGIAVVGLRAAPPSKSA